MKITKGKTKRKLARRMFRQPKPGWFIRESDYNAVVEAMARAYHEISHHPKFFLPWTSCAQAYKIKCRKEMSDSLAAVGIATKKGDV